MNECDNCEKLNSIIFRVERIEKDQERLEVKVNKLDNSHVALETRLQGVEKAVNALVDELGKLKWWIIGTLCTALLTFLTMLLTK